MTRIAFLPLIAGIAYELIRFAGKHADNRVLMTLLAPGLWLQRLTTREPTLDQLEVSIRALRGGAGLRGPAGSRRPTSGGDGVMATTRKAEVVWNGGLLDGERHDRLDARAARCRELAVTWASRSEEPNGKTSPEELIAAAHASCFAMALSFGPRERRDAAERAADVGVEVTFQPGEGITGIALTVRGDRAAASTRRLREPRRGREGELPGLEGAAGGSTITLDAALAGLASALLDGGIWTRLVEELERSYAETRERMSDPAVYNDHREAAEVGRRLKELEGPCKLAQAWRQARADLDAARSDPELAEMVADYQAEVARLEEELMLSLVERDPADEQGRDRRDPPAA